MSLGRTEFRRGLGYLLRVTYFKKLTVELELEHKIANSVEQVRISFTATCYTMYCINLQKFYATSVTVDIESSL